jgi:diguanylate cyclase (GGDEF)-like protein/PAS domain S-box-containing protein
VVLHGRVRWAALLGLGGVAGWLAADVASLLTATGHPPGGWAPAVRTLGVLLLAAVPWTRSRPADRAAAARRPGHGPWRMVLNVAPMLVPAVLEVVAWARGSAVNPVPDVLVWGLLLLLTTIRTRVLALDGERAWAAVRSQARRSEALAVNSSDAVAVVTPEGRLTSDSRSLGRLLGVPASVGDELASLLAQFGVAPDQVRAVLDRTQGRLGAPVELELAGRAADGAARWLGGRAVDLSADPDVAGIVVSVYDITRRKRAEQELAHQAFHDGLTGLANRSLFLDRAEQALRRAGRSGTTPVVLCLDLDGFKDVNDSLGHLAGDALLQEVACRLRDVVRAADTVARLGGDEFAVLVDDPTGGLPAASELAERTLAVLAQPIQVAGHRVSVGASLGIVPAGPEATPTSLLRDGDIAMYRAKAAGRGRWVVFDPEMRVTALERIEVERQLSGALAAGQLRLVYQPVVDLRDGRVTGVEALLRWRHPELGAVGPDRFVPVAEASGLIVPIGRWVLAEATLAAARWQRARPAARLTMAVNVSPRQLASDTFLDDVAAALADSGIAPPSLVLEITETALVTDPDVVAARLAGLRRLGVRIALDDFGTGYSSLSNLRQFPVDVLKIDRSFVELLSGPTDDAAIVHGLVQLGRTLDLEIVAEGVETREQAELLRIERCDLAQGYLFSPPLEADEAARVLTAGEVMEPPLFRGPR